MSETFLEKIVAKTREKVERQKHDTDLEALKSKAIQTRAYAKPRRLWSALSREGETNIIAEIKRASPSKGIINADIDVSALAKQYEEGGASAISVLTENEYFKGSLDDLRTVRAAVGLPILRKDFTVDEFQIYEAAAAGADAILLIVAALDEPDLRHFLRFSQDELGMDALVEVHDREELEIAVNIGATIIGINNRNLHSLEVSLDVSRHLIGDRPGGALMIAESGISTRTEIDDLKRLGFDGFLIGETLMRTADAAGTLGAWI
ncbi:MAG TPA: indole-3-glycerol phosphate synthase TrpC [Pyrinomonadaceae bacterium]|nr:indole-3-glycerol phosphate synthase TrpC [Pyrinomonadaceae bacterium]